MGRLASLTLVGATVGVALTGVLLLSRAPKSNREGNPILPPLGVSSIKIPGETNSVGSAPKPSLPRAGLLRYFCFLIGPGGPYGLIGMESEGRMRAGWFCVQSSLLGDRVTSLEPDSIVLSDGQNSVLRISRQTSQLGNPRPFSMEWVNSRQNPMCFKPVSLPKRIAQGWTDLGSEAKIAVRDAYQKFGWRINEHQPPSRKLIIIGFSSIFILERKEIISRKREAFSKALSSEQRALFVQLIRSREEANADSRDAFRTTDLGAFQQAKGDLLRSLTDRGKKALNELDDFTIPMPQEGYKF